MRVAVIPARGGSKRIPRKNIREFCGQPMIAWSIQSALASGCFDRVIVSTDDSEIASTAIRFGAEAPFLRPARLADDYTGTTAVVKHAVNELQAGGERCNEVCCIYATAPFVCAKDLRRGFELLQKSGGDYAFSVTSYSFPIQRALRINANQRISLFQPEHADTRSQDLVETFHDAGQFYWGTAQAWLDARIIFGPDSIPVYLPRHRVQDIDTLEDWQRAELMFIAWRQLGGQDADPSL